MIILDCLFDWCHLQKLLANREPGLITTNHMYENLPKKTVYLAGVGYLSRLDAGGQGDGADFYQPV